MKKFLFKKLVRDKIAAIIEENKDLQSSIHVLNDEDFKLELNKKLLEEVNELVETSFKEQITEELADILEVIDAIKGLNQINTEEILLKKTLKYEKSGGFKDMKYVEFVEVAESDPIIDLYKKQPNKYIEVVKADLTKYAALIQNEKGQILLGKKPNQNVWINIGGKPLPNESISGCLNRELLEEISTGINLDFEPVLFVQTPATPAIDNPSKTVQIFWYKVMLLDEPKVNQELEEIRWIDPFNLEGLTLSPQILDYLIPKLTAKP